MRLEPGARAPDFTASDWRGATVRLADVPGRRWLAFFRYAACPLCNLRVHHMIERHADLAARGLSILAVFQSPAASIAQHVGRQEPPFPLLSDPEERLYALYGLETSLVAAASPANLGRLAQAVRQGFVPGRPDGSVTRIPGDVLIEADGTIARAFYGRVIADHIPFEEVEAFLASG
jgi:peroxiredoxin Q/BCP